MTRNNHLEGAARPHGPGNAGLAHVEDLAHGGCGNLSVIELRKRRGMGKLIGLLVLSLAGLACTSVSGQVASRLETGTLGKGDATFDSGEFVDRYDLKGESGQLVEVELRSDDFIPFVSIRALNADGTIDESASWWVDGIDSNSGAALLEVELPRDGDYVIDATSHEPGEIGNYELLIRTITGRIEQGELSKGDSTLDDGEFVDVYEFRASQGEQFVVDLFSEQFDTYLFIRSDEDPEFKPDNDDYESSTNRSQIAMTAPFDGVYEVYVTSYAANEIGAYRLAISTSVAATESAMPTWATGALSATDNQLSEGEYYDIFPLFANAGETYQIDLRSANFDTYLLVDLPSNDEFVLENDDFNSSQDHSQIIFQAPETGQYEIYVTSYEGQEVGSYDLTFAKQHERIEYGALDATDGQLTEGEYFDVYEFEATAGQAYTIELSSDTFDTYVGIRDPNDSDFSPFNDDHAASTFRSRVEMVAPRSTVYEIVVTSYEAGETGEYMLTVDRGSGGFQRSSGRLDATDAELTNGEYFDIYEFDGRPGQTARIRLSSPDFDTYVVLKDPNGETVENDDYANDTNLSVVESTLTELGTYQIYVTSYAAAEVGRYEVDLFFDPNSSSGESRDIERIVGKGAFDGRLEDGDFMLEDHLYDLFAFDGEVGQHINIEMTSADFDTFLVLTSPSGLEYDFDDSDSGLNALIEFQLPEAGRYRLRATSYDLGATGDYQVSYDLVDAAPATVVGEPINPGRRILGVFVGISDYQGDDADLMYCDKDAVMVRDVLAQQYDMADNDSVLLTNADATVDNINEAIRRIGARADDDDLLIFFYSGHGGQVKGDVSANSRFDPNGVRETIVAYDGEILDDDFAASINRSAAGTCLVVIDACFSGGFGKNVVSAPGRMGLFSSQEDVLSMVADKFRAGGYLSRFFVDAISTERDVADATVESDGALSAFELQHYIGLRYEQDVRTTKRNETRRSDDYISPENDLSFQRLHADWGGLDSPYQILFSW